MIGTAADDSIVFVENEDFQEFHFERDSHEASHRRFVQLTCLGVCRLFDGTYVKSGAGHRDRGNRLLRR